MDLSKQTNDQLNALCKQKGIRGYSKLKKDEKIAKLVEAGVQNVAEAVVKKSSSRAKKAESKDDKPAKEKKPAVPKKDKLDKKLAKEFDVEKHREALLDFKEEPTAVEIIELLKSDIDEFVNKADDKDLSEFVNKFGALTAINYQRNNKNSKLSAKSDSEIYKTLALYLFMTVAAATDDLVKTVKKAYAKLLKPPSENKPKKLLKKDVKQVDPPNEDEDEDEEEEEKEEEDAVEEDAGEDTYNDSAEDTDF